MGFFGNMGFAFTCCGAEQSLSSRLLPWGAGALLFFLWLPLFLLGFANLSFKQKSLLKILRLLLGGKLDTELAGACCNCRVKGKGLPAQPATSSNQQPWLCGTGLFCSFPSAPCFCWNHVWEARLGWVGLVRGVWVMLEELSCLGKSWHALGWKRP